MTTHNTDSNTNTNDTPHGTTPDGTPLIPRGVINGITDIQHNNTATTEDIQNALKHNTDQ